MSTLLLVNGLHTSLDGDKVRAVARARTLTILRRLDKERRITVLGFLVESGLIDAQKPIINFAQADLREYDLSGAPLGGASLDGANLNEAQYNDATDWPDGFDPKVRGAILFTG